MEWCYWSLWKQYAHPYIPIQQLYLEPVWKDFMFNFFLKRQNKQTFFYPIQRFFVGYARAGVFILSISLKASRRCFFD